MRARWYRTAASAAVLMFALMVAGPALAVTVTSYTPTNAFIPEDPGACVGTSVTINGTGFVNDGGPVTVKFNGTPGVNVVIGSDVIIYAKMPPTATDGLVTVTTARGTASAAIPYDGRRMRVPSGPGVDRSLEQAQDCRLRSDESKDGKDSRDQRGQSGRRDRGQDRWCRCQVQGRLGDEDHGDRLSRSEERQDRGCLRRWNRYELDELHQRLSSNGAAFRERRRSREAATARSR